MTIERTLQKQAGVKSASVNFASETALIEFDENLISEKDLSKTVAGVGYALITNNKQPTTNNRLIANNLETASLKVLGMDSAHCAMMVEQAIGKLAGIDK
ncbi:MAG: heavy metal-associated domain-containing protein, partial [Patescibacteria group bacterium]